MSRNVGLSVGQLIMTTIAGRGGEGRGGEERGGGSFCCGAEQSTRAGRQEVRRVRALFFFFFNYYYYYYFQFGLYFARGGRRSGRVGAKPKPDVYSVHKVHNSD